MEAQLIDPADEVAYNTADLDDAWSAGLIAAGDVAEAVPQYREIHEAVETQFPGATERERFHQALRQLIDLLVSGLMEGTVAAADASAQPQLTASANNVILSWLENASSQTALKFSERTAAGWRLISGRPIARFSEAWRRAVISAAGAKNPPAAAARLPVAALAGAVARWAHSNWLLR